MKRKPTLLELQRLSREWHEAVATFGEDSNQDIEAGIRFEQAGQRAGWIRCLIADILNKKTPRRLNPHG